MFIQQSIKIKVTPAYFNIMKFYYTLALSLPAMSYAVGINSFNDESL
jgi:hypothetical protein